MKQANRKKGFSLIELIVVIAVIAAIAAVIVPQFSNISGAARNSADQRNVQLWNEVYANAYAVIADTQTNHTGNLPTVTPGINANVPEIAISANLGTSVINFNAPAFTFRGNLAAGYSFNAERGLISPTAP